MPRRLFARFGPFRRKHGPTGVPADRLPKFNPRFVAFDHSGRITALVAEGDVSTDPLALLAFGALAVHHTDTDDGSWDGPANESHLPTGDAATASKLKGAFAWVDPDKDSDKKAAYKFIHHEVNADGSIGPANVKACSTGIGVLNGGRGGTTIPDADKKGVYAHLVAHLKDSGVKDEDLPSLEAALQGEDHDMHASTSTTHSHEHSAMGSQGDDATHTHSHSHSGDSSHEHHSASAAASGGDPLAADPPLNTTVTPIHSQADLAAKITELRARQSASTDVQRTKVTLDGFGIELDLAVRWDDDAIDPYVFDPESLTFGRKGAFVSTLTADAGSGIPQIVSNPGAAWHAILCVEGLRTDEDPAREIVPMACQFPDLPVSLRLQIHDEGGHYGAVTCGRIDTMERQDMQGYNAIPATGFFGSDEHGQTAQLLVEEQTQRFISIDPRDVDLEVIEITVATGNPYDGDMEQVVDWWVRYTNLTIGAATIVATPALQQAVITLASVPLPETPIAVEQAQSGGVSTVVTASGGPLEPPAEWFDSPGFHVGDPRLVRQPDGRYACPLTVTDDGRVFGHVCYWGARHTGFLTKRVTPPRSKAALAHFLTGGAVKCAGDTEVFGVGQITMGCGHAETKLTHAPAKAHYDGGYGAVQVADVRAGEDDFGVWIAGAMRSDLTPEQVREFRSTNLSGDWRSIAGSLELIAVLAGVPVPGFPIVGRESLVASGEDWSETRYGVSEGELTSLVAAGRVHRLPVDDRISRLEGRLDLLLSERNARLAVTSRAELAALLDQ